MPNWTRSLFVVAAVSFFSCGDNAAGPPDAPPKPACDDGIDNDGDGLIDFPEDLGCTDLTSDDEDGLVRPRCSDNRDNDGDGKTDFPHDPACLTAEMDNEEDDCPDGPFCPQCSNGLDDDGSGAIDFPADPGCESAADNFEYAGSSQACGANLTLKQLPVSGMDTGMLDTMSTSDITTPCGGGNGAPAIGYVMVLSKPKVVVISTEGSGVDTVLDLRRAPCMDAGSAIECHDNIAANNTTSKITRSLATGVYYIIVQGKTAAQSGPYVLTVQKFNGQGEECNVQGDCGPGLECRVPVGGTEKICTQPVCSDGLDDDGDGLIDHPNDPGCDSPTDGDETDDCPSGPTCPDCADGEDNDGDGDIDYPADTSCQAAGDASEACTTSESIGVITQTITTGDTTNAVNDYDPTCNSTTGLSKDLLYRIDLPAMQALTLNVTGFDAVHTLLDSTCGGTPIACSDPPVMNVSNLAPGTYYVTVEGWSTTGQGPFTIQTSGTIAAGGSCEGTLFQNGVIACGPGFVCDGPPGAKTCSTQCSDGIDNNGDGNIDYPNDPGCSAPNDNSEDTVCPGPLCPQCADGVDNDGDTFIDWPADPSCPAAGGTSEACTTSEPIGLITAAVTTGTTVGATNDHDPTCNSTTGVAPDVLYQLELPAMARLTLNVSGFDTVHTLMDSSCSGQIACSDPALMTQTNLAAGTYFVSIEGWSGTTTGAFTLTTGGEVAPGGSCEGDLFQNGVITCQPGFVCDGPAGARTCRTECSDGIDNNGDGTIDWPADPGCSAPDDDSEDTVCPGPMCPECGDGLDNDGDGDIDWPADTSCLGAGTTSESCVSTEPIGVITAAVTMGTTVGATNDHDPTCNSTTGVAPDVVYELELPDMAVLTLNVTGFDAVHTLFDSSCTTSLACSDPPLMTQTNLAAGKYFVSVEGWSGTTTGAFTLTTGGQVASGGSCEGALFQSGVFTCQPGFVCDGPAGARTCRTECTDGIDNNGDGTIDYPNDPGCSAPSDNSEETVCPGPLCPECADGVDNDGDTLIDYPLDPQCLAAGGTSEACITSEPIDIITTQVTTGTTAGQVNDYKPVCGSATTHNAPDVMWQLDLPQMQSLTLNLTGFDGAHSLLDATCGAPPIACSDPTAMTTNNLPAGRYFVVVDGWSTGNGAYTLTTTGTIAAGASCESPLFTAGAFSCASGSTCQGPAGARTCMSQCSDGIDNNGDGNIDFPDDPACSSAADNTENTVCPGASCPACGDGIDNDGDLTIDYPADVGCSFAAGTTEVFCGIEPNLAGAITTPATSGTLVGAANNYNQTCQSNTGNDVVYALQLPVQVQALRVDTLGSFIDTVISVKDSACGTQLGCNDDSAPGNQSLLNLSNVAPGNYAIQVDSYNSNGANNGPFQLNVRGTVAPGTVCTSPLFASGVLVCGSGKTCTAGVCQ